MSLKNIKLSSLADKINAQPDEVKNVEEIKESKPIEEETVDRVANKINKKKK